MASIAKRDFKLRSPVDPRSRYVWSLTLAALGVQQALYLILGYTVEAWEPWHSLTMATPWFIIAFGLRALGRQVLPNLFETLALLSVTGITLFLLQFPMIELGGPLVDRELLRADRLLGFDWVGFASLFSSKTWDTIILWSYVTFRVQGVAILIFLCCRNDASRAWQMLTAAILAMAVAVVSLFAFPADGSFVGCGLHPPGLPYHWTHCAYAHIVRDAHAGEIHSIGFNHYQGLGSFPSFHIAAGTIFVWAVWKERFLRWPILTLNVLLAIGAIVIGNHYFVDILGGLALAAASIFVVKKLLPERSPNAERGGLPKQTLITTTTSLS